MANFVEQATLKLIDQTSGPADKINGALKRLNATGRSMAGSLNGTASSLNRVAASATAAKVALAGMRAPRALVNPQAAVNLDLVAAALRNYARAASAASRIPPLQPPRIPTVPRIPLGGAGASPVSMGGNIRTGIGREFGAIIAQEFRSLARGTINTAGRGIITVDDAVGMLRQTGLSDAQIAVRKQLASEVSAAYPMISQGLLLDATREAANLARTTGDAREQMMITARNATNLAAVYGDVVKGAEDARQLQRATSLMGFAQDPAKTREFSDAIVRAIVASGGDVTAFEGRRAIQQLKETGLAFNAQAVSDMMSLRDEGGRASTEEIRSFIRDVTRASLNDKGAAKMQAAGIRGADNIALDQETLLANPVDYVIKKILPELLKKGIDTNDRAAVSKAVDAIGFTSTGGAFAKRIIPNIDQVLADRAAAAKVDLETARNRPTLRQQGAEIQSQFQNITAGLAETVMPQVQKAAGTISENLRVLNDPSSTLTQKAAASAAATAAAAAGSGLLALGTMGTNPLAASAVALNGSAAALTASAMALAAGSGVKGIAKAGLAGLAGLGVTGLGLGAMGVGIAGFISAMRDDEMQALDSKAAALTAKIDPFGNMSGPDREARIERARADAARDGEKISRDQAEVRARAAELEKRMREDAGYAAQVAATKNELAAIRAERAALENATKAQKDAEAAGTTPGGRNLPEGVQPLGPAQARAAALTKLGMEMQSVTSQVANTEQALTDISTRRLQNAKKNANNAIERAAVEEQIAADERKFRDDLPKLKAEQRRLQNEYFRQRFEAGDTLPAEKFKRGRSTDTAEMKAFREWLRENGPSDAGGPRRPPEFGGKPVIKADGPVTVDTGGKPTITPPSATGTTPPGTPGTGGLPSSPTAMAESNDRLSAALPTFAQSSESLTSAMTTLPAGLQSAVDSGILKLTEGATTFGTTVATALQAVGPALGAAIGAAFVAAAEGLTVGVRTEGTQPNTGTNNTLR